MKSSNGVDSAPDPRDLSGDGSRNGDGTDVRLRAIENRLTKLETRMEYVAAKEDIETLKKHMEGLKVWMLSRGFAAMVATASIVLTLMKLLFFSDGSG